MKTNRIKRPSITLPPLPQAALSTQTVKTQSNLNVFIKKTTNKITPHKKTLNLPKLTPLDTKTSSFVDTASQAITPSLPAIKNIARESGHSVELSGGTTPGQSNTKLMVPYGRYIEKRSDKINNVRHYLDYKCYSSPYHAEGTIAHFPNNNVIGDVENDIFCASYQPDKWIFIDSKKGNHEHYNMSDVVAEQYRIISVKHGFFGILPSTIRRHNICNKDTLKLIHSTRHLSEHERLSRFMTETVNGKSTQRIADVFGMEPYGFKEVTEDGIYGVHIMMREKPHL